MRVPRPMSSAVLIQLQAADGGLHARHDVQQARQPADVRVSDRRDHRGTSSTRSRWFDQVLALIAYLVALVAAGSVLASIYNSMSARRRDIAILRALGARRRTIFGAVVAEAACIGALGARRGFRGLFRVADRVSPAMIRAQTGVVLDVTALHPVLVDLSAGDDRRSARSAGWCRR